MLRIRDIYRQDASALRTIMRDAVRQQDCSLVLEAVYWLAFLKELPTRQDLALFLSCDFSQSEPYRSLACRIRSLGTPTSWRLDRQRWVEGYDLDTYRAFEAWLSTDTRGPWHDHPDFGELVTVYLPNYRKQGAPLESAYRIDMDSGRFCDATAIRRMDRFEYSITHEIRWDGFRWSVAAYDAEEADRVDRVDLHLFHLGDRPDPNFQIHQQEMGSGSVVSIPVWWNGVEWISLSKPYEEDPEKHKRRADIQTAGIIDPATGNVEPIDLPPPENGYYFTDRGWYDPETGTFSPGLPPPVDSPVGIATIPQANGAAPAQPQKTDWFLIGAGAVLAATIAAAIIIRKK
jgi:hypothetical protein